MATLEILLNKLNVSDSADRDALLSLPFETKTFGPNEHIVHERDTPHTCVIVLSGLLLRFKSGAESRQILSLHPPGDLPDLQSLFLKRMDHGLCTAAAPSTIARVPHADLLALLDRHRRVEKSLWRETLVDASLYREALTNMGTRPAIQRMAHFFCEHFARMKERGLASKSSCELPVTQHHLGEALGISLVSANRCLRTLREKDLCDHRYSQLEIYNWEKLISFADFDEDYLHL